MNFTSSATQVNNLVRGMNSEPMAWCEIGSDQLRVIQSQVYLGSVSTQMNTGEVSKVDGRVVVACGNDTYLELLQVQPSSKNPMSAKDWLNGKTGQVVLS
jgi:methionyl-tRNA formyltransferase